MKKIDYKGRKPNARPERYRPQGWTMSCRNNLPQRKSSSMISSVSRSKELWGLWIRKSNTWLMRRLITLPSKSLCNISKPPRKKSPITRILAWKRPLLMSISWREKEENALFPRSKTLSFQLRKTKGFKQAGPKQPRKITMSITPTKASFKRLQDTTYFYFYAET